MRKYISFLLAFMLVFMSLVGCNNVTPPESGGNPNEQPNQTPVTPPSDDGFIQGPNSGENQPTTPPEEGGEQPDTPPASGEDQPTTPPDSGDVITGEFVTKYQTYTFEGNNLAIIKLENHTTQNYTVTINAKYLDAAGNELKAETQTFEGFPAGWENHLVFKPDFPFAKFTYTVDLNVYQGECAISAETKAKVTRVYETKIWIMSQVHQGDYTKYPTILAEAEWENASGIYAKRCVVIFDNTGEIYAILYKNGTISQSPETVGYYLLQTTDETIVWPDEIKSGVTGIVAIVSATK